MYNPKSLYAHFIDYYHAQPLRLAVVSLEHNHSNRGRSRVFKAIQFGKFLALVDNLLSTADFINRHRHIPDFNSLEPDIRATINRIGYKLEQLQEHCAEMEEVYQKALESNRLPDFRAMFSKARALIRDFQDEEKSLEKYDVKY